MGTCLFLLDCVIIALDDDKPSDYTQSAVEKLLGYYIHSGKSQIVALKARRIGLCPTLDKVELFSYILLIDPPAKPTNQSTNQPINNKLKRFVYITIISILYTLQTPPTRSHGLLYLKSLSHIVYVPSMHTNMYIRLFA